MKKGYVFVTLIITMLAFTAVTYTSCVKDSCAGVTCLNYGTCYGGSCSCPTGYAGRHCENLATTYVEYFNDTYTPIIITAGGNTNTIPVGGSITYTGSYGDKLTGTATTSGTTSNGSVVGITLSWTLDVNFPATGTLQQPLDVQSDYFFLQIANTSPYSIQRVYVNYGLNAQTVDNITIPNNGVVYGTGYYEAYTNSNARLESATSYWYFSPLALSFTDNQVVTITAN